MIKQKKDGKTERDFSLTLKRMESIEQILSYNVVKERYLLDKMKPRHLYY